MRRARTLLTLGLVLIVGGLAAGCGRVSSLSHLESSLTHRSSSSHISVWQAGWCAYHVWRLEQDVQHHKLGWAAFQAALSVHHCKRIRR